MKRRLLQFAFGIGLLLTLAIGGLIVRGMWVTDVWRITWSRASGEQFVLRHLEWYGGADAITVASDRDEMRLAAARALSLEPGWRTVHATFPARSFWPRLDGPSPWQRLGFEYWVRDDFITRIRPGLVSRRLTVPTWFLLLTAVTMTAWPARSLWRARRRSSRLERGLCPACAYDLRGAAHERCPECGEAVVAPARV